MEISGADLPPEARHHKLSVAYVSLDWRGRIPFLVRLRDCDDGQLPSPDNFPELIAREIGAESATLGAQVRTRAQDA